MRNKMLYAPDFGRKMTRLFGEGLASGPGIGRYLMPVDTSYHPPLAMGSGASLHCIARHTCPSKLVSQQVPLSA
jgi:hypothetical protein